MRHRDGTTLSIMSIDSPMNRVAAAKKKCGMNGNRDVIVVL